MLTTDSVRGSELARLLHANAITGENMMPEDELPAGVAKGSLQHAMFITLTVAINYLTVAINYQRDAVALWAAARHTLQDCSTSYLFDPAALATADWRRVTIDMQRHGLSKKPNKDSAIWRTVGITFYKKWDGDPRRFLADCGWSAPTILARLQSDNHFNNKRAVPDYPYLRGPKIGPLWLRMLRDNVGLEIENLDAVPIPVDVHVARATLALGVLTGDYEGPSDAAYDAVRHAWRDSVRGLSIGSREMIPLDLDEALWRLSKYGCTHRDLETGDCRCYGGCVAKEFCVKGRISVQPCRVHVSTATTPVG